MKTLYKVQRSKSGTASCRPSRSARGRAVWPSVRIARRHAVRSVHFGGARRSECTPDGARAETAVCARRPRRFEAADVVISTILGVLTAVETARLHAVRASSLDHLW